MLQKDKRCIYIYKMTEEIYKKYMKLTIRLSHMVAVAHV